MFHRLIPALLPALLLTVLSPASSATVPQRPFAGPTAQLSGAVQTRYAATPGAQVTVYSAGSTKGAGAQALGSTTTRNDGRFELFYREPASRDAVLYAIADGPVTGIRFATVLGSNPPSNVTINERSTVATAWAMAQFLDEEQIGGNAVGLKNAAATLRNLVDLRSGRVGGVLGAPPNGTLHSSMATFNSLANLLAGCTSSGIGCDALFAVATTPDGSVPDDTLEAMLNIAHNPWNNADQIHELSTFSEVFTPALAAPPVTWTLVLKYVGNGQEFDGPGAVAFDAEGNAWISNNYTWRENHDRPACDNKYVLKLTPDGYDAPGAPFTGGGLSGAGFGITVDPNGDAWVGNFGFFGSTCPDDELPAADSVSYIRSDGVPYSGPNGFTAGDISGAQGTVSDQAGNIWIASSCNGHVVRYGVGCKEYPGACPENSWTFDANVEFGTDKSKPFDIAVDAVGNAWVTDNNNEFAFQLDQNGTLIGRSTPDAQIHWPMGVAIDSLGYVWVANSGLVRMPCAGNAVYDDGDTQDLGPLIPDLTKASVIALNPDGSPLRPDLFTGGGVSVPWGIAVDGNDNIWVANFGDHAVSHFRGANASTWPLGVDVGEPIAPDGYVSDALMRNTGVSIDASGNVWLTNNWLDDAPTTQTNPGGDSMAVFVGLAAPVKMPLLGPPQQP